MQRHLNLCFVLPHLAPETVGPPCFLLLVAQQFQCFGRRRPPLQVKLLCLMFVFFWFCCFLFFTIFYLHNVDLSLYSLPIPMFPGPGANCHRRPQHSLAWRMPFHTFILFLCWRSFRDFFGSPGIATVTRFRSPCSSVSLLFPELNAHVLAIAQEKNTFCASALSVGVL